MTNVINKKNILGISFYLTFSFTLILLLSLGTWQLEKHRKASKIKEIRSKSYLLSFNNLKEMPENKINYSRININGLFLNKRRIILGPRTLKGKVGSHILVPLKVRNEYVLINRGFVEEKNLEGYIKKFSYDENLYLEAVLFVIPKPGMFAVKNDPEKKAWHTLNLEEISSYLEIQIPSYVLYEQNNQNKYIVKIEPNKSAEINHLEYAFTWFALALCLCIVSNTFVLNQKNV